MYSFSNLLLIFHKGNKIITKTRLKWYIDKVNLIWISLVHYFRTLSSSHITSTTLYCELALWCNINVYSCRHVLDSILWEGHPVAIGINWVKTLPIPTFDASLSTSKMMSWSPKTFLLLDNSSWTFHPFLKGTTIVLQFLMNLLFFTLAYSWFYLSSCKTTLCSIWVYVVLVVNQYSVKVNNYKLMDVRLVDLILESHEVLGAFEIPNGITSHS